MYYKFLFCTDTIVKIKWAIFKELFCWSNLVACLQFLLYIKIVCSLKEMEALFSTMTVSKAYVQKATR